MKAIKIISSIIAGIAGLIGLVFLAGYFHLIPNFKALVVLSGSMEPEVKTGSVAVVVPSSSYLSSDIISFYKNGDKKNIVTHRVFEKTYPDGIYGNPVFLTKGDANNKIDQEKVNEGQIIGKLVFSLPYCGYFANFVKQPYGFILFVVIPATIIVYEELKKLKDEAVGSLKKLKKKNPENSGPVPQGKTNPFVIAIPVIAAAFALTSLSLSFFSDREDSVSNSFVAGVWITPSPILTPTPTPTPTVAPTPTPTPTPTFPVAGSVVIYELMWMGSMGNSDDEWIELRNTTSNPIDLSNWQITSLVGAGNTETLMLTIPSGKTISANGYFLISYFNKDTSAINIEPDLVDTGVVLRNSDLQIKLYKGLWTDSANLIDTADDGSETPLAGVNGENKQSMERYDDPSTGWQTCTNDTCSDTTYWDIKGNNYGTPKTANLY